MSEYFLKFVKVACNKRLWHFYCLSISIFKYNTNIKI